MTGGVERCPRCPGEQLAAFTDGNGRAFLECLNCRYIEPIRRKADPDPTVYYTTTNAAGVTRKQRRRTSSQSVYRGRIPKLADQRKPAA